MNKTDRNRKNKEVTLFWNLIRSYIHDYLPKIRNASQNTTDTYKDALNRFIDYLSGEKNIPRFELTYDALNRHNLNDYLKWMQETKKLCPTTCNLRITAVRSFMEYSAQEDVTLVAVYHELSSVKNLKFAPSSIDYIRKDAMTALIAAPNIKTSLGKRDRMMLIFEYDAALRVSELVNVKLCHLHLNENTPFVTIKGKGGKIRNVPLMRKTVDHLKLYLDVFHPGGIYSTESPLFYTKRKLIPQTLSTDAVEKFLKKYAIIAKTTCPNVPLTLHCHLIRKTRAMDLYQAGIPIAYIAEVLGHSSITTTSGFYAFATLETLHEAFKKGIPEAFQDEPIWKKKEVIDRLYTI